MKASTLTLRIISVILLLALPRLATADVGIYGANNQTWNEEVRDTIATAAGGSLGTIDFFDAGSLTPTLAELQTYTAVLVYSDGGFQDSVAMGDALADYVDSGGVVVLATFAFNGDIEGRIVTDNYLPVTIAGQSSPGGLTLVPIDAGNPLLAGVTTFAGGTSSYHNTVVLAAGGTVIAEWSNGVPLVAVKGAVVALNFYPPSDTSRGDFWDASTDGGILMANALGSTGVVVSGAPSAPTQVPVMGPLALLFLTLAMAIIGGITFRQKS